MTPRPRTALVLGASRYYSRSITAAREAGYRIVAVDRDSEATGLACADVGLTCDIVDRAAVLSIAREYAVDGIIPVNDYGVRTAAYVAGKCGLNGLSERAALLSTNKEEMRKKWQDDGVPCPRFMIGEKEQELRDAIERIGIPCILKPAHGIGGASRGVVVVKESSLVSKAIGFAQSFYDDKATLVEEFVEVCSEHSAEVLVHKGTSYVIAIGDKVKTPLPYRVDKSVIYPTALSDEMRHAAVAAICHSVESLGVDVGAAHVEFGVTDNRIVLFELGARCGGGGTPEPIVRHVTGVDEFVETVRILCGDDPKNLKPLHERGCTYHFLTPHEGVVKAIRGLDEVQSLDGILDVALFIEPGDTIEKVTVGGQRSGFIIASGGTREEACDLARRAESLIEIEYRTHEGPQAEYA